MALFPMTNAGAGFTLEEPQTVDQYYQGIRIKADFSAAFATLSEGVEYSNGLRLLASGQLSIVDASSGLPAGTTYVNGIPITSDGKLCVSTNAIASWSNGIAFDAAGAVVDAAFRIASVNPVLWWDAESHRAGLAGGAATLFQDSAGTSAVTAVEQPVGRAIDQSGNARHALQATSTARPLLTARKNLLGFSEQFDNAYWQRVNDPTVLSNVAAAPDGTTTADSVQAVTGGAYRYVASAFIVVQPNATVTASIHVKKETSETAFGGISLDFQGGTRRLAYVGINAVAGTAANLPGGGLTPTISVVDAGAYWRLIVTVTDTGSNTAVSMLYYANLSIDNVSINGSGSASSPRVIWGAQLELGSLATAYQRITTASDYDITAAPLMLRFDGLDDSLSSTTLSDGTLPTNADVYMIVKRAPGDGISALLYSGANFVGMTSPVSSLRPDGNAGTPTYTVNGVAIAATQIALNSALSEGTACLLEVKNANLSTWTTASVGLFTGAPLTGEIGDVLIAVAQSDTVRTKIRKALAKTYQIQGVV